MQKLTALPGSMMANWFCRTHVHEFLVFTYTKGTKRITCPACMRERMKAPCTKCKQYKRSRNAA